jgi:hypothetical protein
MARGDVYNKGVDEIDIDAYFNIQPPEGVEVVIHNISRSDDAILEFYDGTTAVTVDTQVGQGSWMGMFLHCTNSKYYRIKNTNVSSNNICCDGIQTK